MSEPVPVPSCPGCRSGDHQKCDNTAWDEEEDKLAPCACRKANHGQTPVENDCWDCQGETQQVQIAGHLSQCVLCGAENPYQAPDPALTG